MWKVLVVDDNHNNCELLVSTLDGMAHCDVAHSGEEALKCYQAALKDVSPYDVILLDIAMPGLDGVDVLKFIRSQEEERGVGPDKGVVIFMVTAHKEPFINAFNVGCDDYILKPIDPDHVITKMTQRLNK